MEEDKITPQNVDFMSSIFRGHWTDNTFKIRDEMKKCGCIKNEKIFRLIEKDSIELQIRHAKFKIYELEEYARSYETPMTDYELSVIDERNKNIDMLEERLKSYNDI